MAQVSGSIRWRLRIYMPGETNDVHYTRREAASQAFNVVMRSGAPIDRIELTKVTEETIRIWERK